MLTQPQELLLILAQTTTSDRQASIAAYMQKEIALAIGISASELDIQQPLNHMGIDSLLAVELRNKLRTALNVDVAAVKFMEDTSVASLAIQVSELLTTNPPPNLFASVPQQVRTQHPLSHGQRGLWFLYKLTPNRIVGTWRFDDARPLTDTLAQELLNGNIYASFHTANFPSSEIRGQLIADRTSVPEREPSLGVYLLALGACGAVSQLKNQKNPQKLANRDSPTVAKTAG